MTSCSCDQSEGSTYTLSCDRVSLDRVPRLTSEVVELHMFRTNLLDKTLGSTSLRLASSLQVEQVKHWFVLQTCHQSCPIFQWMNHWYKSYLFHTALGFCFATHPIALWPNYLCRQNKTQCERCYGCLMTTTIDLFLFGLLSPVMLLLWILQGLDIWILCLIILQVFSIESCDLIRIERSAFTGLYSMTSLNLAYNDLHTLPYSVFSDLNLLQTLGKWQIVCIYIYWPRLKKFYLNI